MLTLRSPEVQDIQLHHVDDRLLVAEKPSGLLCQPGLGPELADSLITRLERDWPTARLVHRLDRDTSGLLLVALDSEMHRALSRLFAQREIHKIYVADVAGVPDSNTGTITLAIGKRSHRPPIYGPDLMGKPCTTHWRLLRACGEWSRLELNPETGRSHQLRVHLTAIGHPILGDPLYGNPDHMIANRLRLHASQIAFMHPFTGESLRFDSVCPFMD